MNPRPYKPKVAKVTEVTETENNAKVDGLGYDIKSFRSDHGSGEHNNRLSTLAARGIRFEPAPPCTQHKNGVAERMVGTLTEKAKAMMLDSQAPMQFWAEAVNTACYLHARTPNRTLDGKTPYEMLRRHRRLHKADSNARATARATSISRLTPSTSFRLRSL